MVVILSGSGDPDKTDAETLQPPKSLTHAMEGFVVAEVRDVDNEPLVKLVGGNIVETLVSHDVLGRLMLMSVRQPGLAKVYEALLGFEGDEFYMKELEELEGQQFGDLIERFPDAVPIGVQTSEGTVSVRRKLEQLPVETFNSCMIFADQFYEADAMLADSPPAPSHAC